ncbi:MAG: DUF5678 domain-containing protein [Nitrososphaeraceae archaeon]
MSSNIDLLKSFKKNSEWFDNNYQSLQKYDGQFVAIYKEGLLDSDNDYQTLINRTKRLCDKSLYVTLVTWHGTISPAK